MTRMLDIEREGRRVPVTVTAAWLLIGGLVWGLAGCGAGPGDGEQLAKVPRNVRVLTLQETPLVEYFEIAGPVQPVRGTDVSAEENGTVARIPHDKGEKVAAGAILVELDRRLLQAEMESARSALELQKYDYDQTRQLFEAGKVSRHELLTLQTGFEQAQAASRIADLRYERAAVKAPFAGLVADRFVEPGQLVTAGTPVGRVIDPFTLKLVGTLTDLEIGWVRLGTTAEVFLGGRTAPVTGTVAWVGFEAHPGNGKFKAEIHIDNADLEFRGGVIGRARILKQDHGLVIAVPYDAVLPADGGQIVFVVEGQTARRRPVTLGPDQGLMVIVESGLAAGDRLVVRGQRDLVDGAVVLVTEETAAADGSGDGDPRVIQASEANLRTWSDQEGRR